MPIFLSVSLRIRTQRRVRAALGSHFASKPTGARSRSARAKILTEGEYSSALHPCGGRLFCPCHCGSEPSRVRSNAIRFAFSKSFAGAAKLPPSRAFSSVAPNSSFSHFIGQILKRYFLLLFHQKNHMTYHALYPKTKVCDFRSLLHLFFGFKNRESRLMKKRIYLSVTSKIMIKNIANKIHAIIHLASVIDPSKNYMPYSNLHNTIHIHQFGHTIFVPIQCLTIYSESSRNF